MLSTLKCAVRNLRRKKARSTLTILGIAIGVASVVLIGNISQCGSNAVNNELNSLGLGGLTISASMPIGTSAVSLSEEDLSLIRTNSCVEEATPVMLENTWVCDRQNTPINTILWGIDSKAKQIVSLTVLYGRAINPADVSFAKNVCMVDEKFSKALYARENIVGKKIPISCGQICDEFEVIGVIKTGSGLLQSAMGEYIPNFVYVPYTTMQNAVERRAFDQIAVKIKKNTDAETAGENIVRCLARANGTSSADYHANNLSKQKSALTNLLNIITIILSAVGAISLVVASLSIMTVMLVSVNERTREIGIKKSIGAPRKAILFEFLLEALLLSVIGCIAGAIVGNLISYAGALYFKIPLNVRLDIMLLSMFFSVISGVIFGVYPAAKASSLRPVDALRSE